MFFVLFLSAQMVAQDSMTTQPATTTTTTTSAQDAEAPRRFGIYAGANFAKINGNDAFDESATGFNAGLMWCVLSTGGLLSVWLEPGYNQIGAKSSYSTGGGSETFKLGYIMLPIMARLQTGIGLYGEIGVQTQLLVSAKRGSADFKDDLNDFDWGVPVGLGFEFRKRVGISARYYFGFADVTDDSSIDSNDKNNVVSLRLHLRL